MQQRRKLEADGFASACGQDPERILPLDDRFHELDLGVVQLLDPEKASRCTTQSRLRIVGRGQPELSRVRDIVDLERNSIVDLRWFASHELDRGPPRIVTALWLDDPTGRER